MKEIWKYETIVNNEFKEEFNIKMPKNSEILCVQTDEKTNIPCLWVMVDPNCEEFETYYFELIPTGKTFKDDKDREYIGTYQYQKGAFVGHIFEIIK